MSDIIGLTIKRT